MVRRISAAQNNANALNHCTVTNTTASLNIKNESRIAGAVCISLLATRPAHAGLKWRREHLVLDDVINENDHWSRNQHHHRHQEKQAEVITEKARRRCGSLHKIYELRQESREHHLAQCGQQVEEEDEHERRPYRLYIVPVKRQQRVRGLNDSRAHERIDSRFKPAEH